MIPLGTLFVLSCANYLSAGMSPEVSRLAYYGLMGFLFSQPFNLRKNRTDGGTEEILDVILSS